MTDEMINYVEREVLSPLDTLQGFSPFKSTCFSTIITSVKSASRLCLECDEDRQQIILYAVIRNKNTILTYKRAGSEDRLTGAWSCGIGGHWKSDESLYDALCRELDEETNLTLYDELQPFGFVRTSDTEVDRVHFGIVFLIDTDQPVRMKTECSAQKWQHPSRINIADFESWSRHIIDILRRHPNG